MRVVLDTSVLVSAIVSDGKSRILFMNGVHKKYDIIVCNPPYCGSDLYSTLPKEYEHEPHMAFVSDNQGLEIPEKVILGAKNYLEEQGILIVEVGYNQERMEQRFPELPFVWLEFERGGEGVLLLNRDELP